MNKNIQVQDLKRGPYDKKFKVTPEYKESLPDIQNGEYDGTPIDFVGIHDFKIPIKIREATGGTQETQANISGSVSLSSAARGINMSRIIRTFYRSKDDIFDINKLEEVLRNYQKDLKQFDAHILMNFKYHQWIPALRTTEEDGHEAGGYQFYNITFDCNLDRNGVFKKVMWIDFVYSSACPCSTELSFHAAYSRGVYGIPHSQRSIARIGIEFDKIVWIEDVLNMCRERLLTETLVFCKREDEQAFAELNGSQPKFVEDAVRFLKAGLDEMENVKDYKIICVHDESLHSHNAFSVLTKGVPGSIFNHHVSLGELENMRV